MKQETTKLMFSSKSDEWGTDDAFYSKLHKIFSFTLDPCASDENHKCQKYYTMESNGLAQDWGGENVFVNNPYSSTKDWTRKCAEEARKPNTTVVQLIPSRTDTKYSQDIAFPNSRAVLFVKGRLKFGGAKTSAPFPSMVVIYSDEILSAWKYEKLLKLGCVMTPYHEGDYDE